MKQKTFTNFSGYIRHGERSDQASGSPLPILEKDINLVDPPLTLKGIE